MIIYDLLTAIVEFHIFFGHAFLEGSSAALHIELMLVLEWLPSEWGMKATVSMTFIPIPLENRKFKLYIP